MRLLLTSLSVLALVACKEQASTPPAPAPAEPEQVKVTGLGKKKPKDTSKAEVEFFGKWAPGDVKAAKVVFVAQAEPCTPVPQNPTRYGEQVLDQVGPLFAEFFITQGTVGHGCLYGLDEAGKVVGVAGSDQNPMRFEGTGEVVFGKLDYVLKAPAPAAP